jgi:Carboxypeptidase regulatory-like domain
MRLVKLVLAIPALCLVSYAQPIPSLSQKIFRVRGEVGDTYSSAIAGAQVKFEGSNRTETVTSDRRGFYRAELPVGLYTMTVEKGSPGSGKYYRRPLFEVLSPKTILLDATLYPSLPSCDPGVVFERRPDGTTKSEIRAAPDTLRDVCGGWDRYPLPSKEGVPFELLVRYSGRVRRGGERIYNGGFRNPVLIAFNLFTLTADQVTYDLDKRIVLAVGNVTTTNGSAGSAHANSMKLKIANHSVQRLP